MKTSFALRVFSLLLLLTTLAAGCAAAPELSNADLLSTVVAQTLTAVPPTVSPPTLVLPQIVTAESPAIPEASSTPEAAGVRYVYTDADNVNLRVLPGTLFKVSRVMAKGSRLQLIGASSEEECVAAIMRALADRELMVPRPH